MKCSQSLRCIRVDLRELIKCSNQISYFRPARSGFETWLPATYGVHRGKKATAS